ncbi:unnamed protein product [Diatraea saccharalis]|uniref:Uncharacterized protein n=1 Tax=Diatraea saccharalis TaxID=40085 RepID=A0A9N9R9W2_9NEOP|nr:unnamed protein product [Diatraea saccharalis]
MLKAGEYSPNNPLVRGERASGDVLLGLGEYERRRQTLRRIRQQQYREYLDQQAKKKQEEKEQAERERREREQREREYDESERAREERDRQQRERALEQTRRSPERRRSSVSYTATQTYRNKVDTGVQVSSVTTPLSVAVQTDDIDFYELSSSKCQLTEAERELSPHTVITNDEKQIEPIHNAQHRRRSCGDHNERSPVLRKPNQKLQTVYMPSIFDADAIQIRNMQVEKEAAARRQFYQQELKNQIMEQQRIREERKAREKMLEQAEMRRLEEQLKMLRAAQEQEKGKHREMDITMKKNAIEYDIKRTELQKEIDYEQRKLIRTPLTHHPPQKRVETSKSEGTRLPFYYPSVPERNFTYDTKYSTNEETPYVDIQQNLIFAPTYDVDSYLRRNLNFRDNIDRFDIENIGAEKEKRTERVLVHDRPKPKAEKRQQLTHQSSIDSLPIPVLRHSPLVQSDKVGNNMSDAMKIVDDKWKVPVVQKNILKSVPNDEGKNVSILTQLGSIRRQLQLEQLKLDKMSEDGE